MPSIKINVPRSRGSMTTRKVKHHRRRRGGGGSSSLTSSERIGAMGAALLLGFLDKSGTSLPTVPLLGRAGTLGVGSYFLGKHMRSPTLNHAATGFLCIALYELGREGKIAGVDGAAAVV